MPAAGSHMLAELPGRNGIQLSAKSINLLVKSINFTAKFRQLRILARRRCYDCSSNLPRQHSPRIRIDTLSFHQFEHKGPCREFRQIRG
jgi:hypothetical protein